MSRINLQFIMVYLRVSFIIYLASNHSQSPPYPLSELSEVLWDMILAAAIRRASDAEHMFTAGTYIAIFFFIWAVLNLALLICMEGLSAYLHTLRLHWVEFMSKFYDGKGYAFAPFCFHTMARLAEEGR